MAQEAFIGSIGSQIFDSFITDVIAIYDSNYNQLFKNARPMKAEVREDSKLMEHPLETGTTIIDHRIINPIEIEFSLLISGYFYQDIYQEVKQIFNNADLLIITTRSDTYENQIIQSLPHTETSEVYNGFILTLKTKEASFVTPEITLAPVQPSDTSTVKKGNVQGTNIPDDQIPNNNKTILQQAFGGFL